MSCLVRSFLGWWVADRNGGKLGEQAEREQLQERSKGSFSALKGGGRVLRLFKVYLEEGILRVGCSKAKNNKDTQE